MLQLESEELQSAVAGREMDNLREQNAKLKSVIKLMRDEMETLGSHQQQHAPTQTIREPVAVMMDKGTLDIITVDRPLHEMTSILRHFSWAE